MNEFISIMQDVAKLATGGSDIARAEARRIDAERRRRAEERAERTALHPAAIVATGGATRPVERLMGLQWAFSRTVAVMAAVCRFSL